MSAIVAPDEAEMYLLAIMDGPDGIDLAEFCWRDEETEDGCFRAWDFQWPWYTCEDTLQIDQCGRSIGKSNGIQMRAFAFPYNFPGAEMLITAPELNHLRPLVDAVEARFLACRMGTEMLPKTKGHGLSRQPHWKARFANGSRIESRLPHKDGKGVKGCTSGTHIDTVYGPDDTIGHMLIEGAVVLTRRGHVPVEEVRVGDDVLTHLGRWRPVLANIVELGVPGLRVIGAGHRGLDVSDNHRLYGRRNSNPQRARNLAGPTWLVVDDEELGKRWYAASPMSVPPEPVPWFPNPDAVALLELAGAYVADGVVGGLRQPERPRRAGRLVVEQTVREQGDVGSITLTDDGKEMPRLAEIFTRLGLRYTIRRHSDDRNAAQRISTLRDGQQVANWLVEHFGRRAEGKRLPTWLLGAEEGLRAAFLTGYLSGDGSYDEAKQRWTASTASKELAIGLRLLGQSLGSVCGYSWVDPKQTEIMGSTLKNPARRSHRVTFTTSSRNAVVDRGLSWQKLRGAEPVKLSVVHDLVVAEDHSYVADGLIHMGSPFLPDGTVA